MTSEQEKGNLGLILAALILAPVLLVEKILEWVKPARSLTAVSGSVRVITRHLVRRTAEQELRRLWKLQEGLPGSAAEMTALGITATSRLTVVHEPKRLYKWAVVTP